MKTIQLNDKTIIGVHILSVVTDGNHVPYTVKKTYTIIDDGFNTFEINEFDYESQVVGSGIRKLTGTVERGGGRMSFYGIDLNKALDLLQTELNSSLA